MRIELLLLAPKVYLPYQEPLLETDAKNLHWLKIWMVVKNPQFLSNKADIPAISPSHELVILTKFYKEWQKIVDFF